jgi:hypothetical protein
VKECGNFVLTISVVNFSTFLVFLFAHLALMSYHLFNSILKTLFRPLTAKQQQQQQNYKAKAYIQGISKTNE